MNETELKHYGVMGMKWGVRKANYKAKTNERLRDKALSYDKKSALLTKKSEKAHSKYDLEQSNRAATKSSKYEAKAATISKRALQANNELTRSRLNKKSETLKYKAAKAQRKADTISKTAGYGRKAMRYSIRSDKAAIKAAKIRKTIANNEWYIAKTNQKLSEIPTIDVDRGRLFIDSLLKE